ncbi:competence protein CoiA [Lacticaseibacillus sp. GG6-2]
MFIAMNAKTQLVQLHTHEEATRLRGNAFYCPACRRPVRIKNGAVMPAHFAHIGPACEAASEGESADHLAGKRWLAGLGERLGYHVALETYYPVIKQRADVVWIREDTTLVLEFQCSPLSGPRLQERTAGYQKLGLTCVWIMGPRYHTKRPGNLQAKFLQSQQPGDYHLWFSKGQSLARWQWRSGGYTITRYDGGPVQTQMVNVSQSRYQAARLVVNQLRHRDRRVMRLQAEAYQQHRNLAGVPWVVHDGMAGVPGLRKPEWQLRTHWLLQFGDGDVDRPSEQAFWREEADPALTPLVDAQALMRVVADRWHHELQRAGLLATTATGWRWLRPAEWYPDYEHKLAALNKA